MSNILIYPTQNFLLVRMKNLKEPEGGLILPQASEPMHPYGEVIARGPHCKICDVGDNVLFLPNNMVAGFDEGPDAKFIIAETAVFGKVVLS